MHCVIYCTPPHADSDSDTSHNDSSHSHSHSHSHSGNHANGGNQEQTIGHGHGPGPGPGPGPGHSSSSDRDRDSDITVVDNQTRFGTYIVSGRGVRRVSGKLSRAAALTEGDLLCVGVAFNGAEAMDADEASSACVVYRLCKC